MSSLVKQICCQLPSGITWKFGAQIVDISIGISVDTVMSSSKSFQVRCNSDDVAQFSHFIASADVFAPSGSSNLLLTNSKGWWSLPHKYQSDATELRFE